MKLRKHTYLIFIIYCYYESSAFRLTRPSTNSDGKSSLRGVNDREYKDHSRHRTRREHTDTRKRSRSRNSQRIEDDIDRQHRSTMFLLRNEQHASQIKNSDFKNVSSSGAISNIKHRLDSFLSMPEERVRLVFRMIDHLSFN